MTDSEWRLDINPGFKTKIIRVGNSTVEIIRPLLDEKEEARRKNQVEDALRQFGRAMFAKEERSAIYE